jgi:hypothetical protein
MLVVLATCVGLALTQGCGSKPATAPTAYTAYQAKDQSFRCEYPTGWEAQGGGAGGYASAIFSQGSATIKVSADTVGSLFGDIAKSFSQAGGKVDEENRPLIQVHAKGKKQVAEEFGGFAEVATEKVQSRMGETLRTEFTAARTFGGKIHGYQSTTLGVERRLTVVCTCAEGDWQTLKPAFEKVIASVGR